VRDDPAWLGRQVRAAARSTTTGRLSDHREGIPVLRPVILVLLLVCLLAACSGSAEHDGTAKWEAKHYPLMPHLHGMDILEAYARLDDMGLPVRNESFSDLSVRHRQTDGVHDWTVWSSTPAAGEEVKPGAGLRIFMLKLTEWKFFDQNRAMPKMPVQSGRAVPSPYPMPFQDVVSELVEWRYVPKYAPKGAEQTRNWPQPDSGLPAELDQSLEPASERARRARYREADDFAAEARHTAAARPDDHDPGEAVAKAAPGDVPELHRSRIESLGGPVRHTRLRRQ
jgi:hypothetical protein